MEGQPTAVGEYLTRKGTNGDISFNRKKRGGMSTKKRRAATTGTGCNPNCSRPRAPMLASLTGGMGHGPNVPSGGHRAAVGDHRDPLGCKPPVTPPPPPCSWSGANGNWRATDGSWGWPAARVPSVRRQ